MIKVGEQAPEFNLKNHKGEEVKLSDYKGKKVVIGWHPLAWTSVCTDQMRALESNFQAMADKGVGAVFGVSVDAVPSKLVWATGLGIENVQLLSDFEPKGKMSKDYGIYLDEDGMSGRGTVIIDEEGVVIYSVEEEIPNLPDMDKILEAL